MPKPRPCPLGESYKVSGWLKTMGGNGGTVVRALASHQCGLGLNLGADEICGWICCWFTPLLREISLQVPRFPLSLKTNKSKFLSIWTHFSEFLRTPKFSKLITITIKNGPTNLGKWKQVYRTWQSLMLLLKCLLPWQLLVLPQIKHVHVVSERQKQAKNQEKVYWINP